MSDTSATGPADPAARVFDPGLQPERTALAWRRTCLSLAIGALVGWRVLPHYWGAAGMVAAGFAVLIAAVLLVLAHVRYRDHHDRLVSGRFRHQGLPDGFLPALLAGASVAAGVAALLLTLVM